MAFFLLSPSVLQGREQKEATTCVTHLLESRVAPEMGVREGDDLPAPGKGPSSYPAYPGPKLRSLLTPHTHLQSHRKSRCLSPTCPQIHPLLSGSALVKATFSTHLGPRKGLLSRCSAPLVSPNPLQPEGCCKNVSHVTFQLRPFKLSPPLSTLSPGSWPPPSRAFLGRSLLQPHTSWFPCHRPPPFLLPVPGPHAPPCSPAFPPWPFCSDPSSVRTPTLRLCIWQPVHPQFRSTLQGAGHHWLED